MKENIPVIECLLRNKARIDIVNEAQKKPYQLTDNAFILSKFGQYDDETTNKLSM